ncbi:MAG: peptidase S41, partial [Flavobacteriaceae bacterium]|nr:peptidase S41 [Flavobacteriaceae bacterium]
KNSAITDAILNSQAIFDFATQYYYNHQIEDINSFQFSDADFNAFKTHLKSSSFEFETETEAALKKAFEVSKTENLNDDIQKEYNALLQHLNETKIQAVDQNKAQLVNLLTDEIVKRYVYREGLYDYYKVNNQEIKTATQILANPNKYNKYLN